MTFLFGNRFVDYKPTSLEKNYKHEMLTEVDLGVNIDLIDPDTYAVDQNGEAWVKCKFDLYTTFCFKGLVKNQNLCSLIAKSLQNTSH